MSHILSDFRQWKHTWSSSANATVSQDPVPSRRAGRKFPHFERLVRFSRPNSMEPRRWFQGTMANPLFLLWPRSSPLTLMTSSTWTSLRTFVVSTRRRALWVQRGGSVMPLPTVWMDVTSFVAEGASLDTPSGSKSTVDASSTGAVMSLATFAPSRKSFILVDNTTRLHQGYDRV
jgi:hypothetical protein